MNRKKMRLPVLGILLCLWLASQVQASGGLRPGGTSLPAPSRQEAGLMQRAMPRQSLAADSCDLIFLHTGEAMQAKFLRMTADEIHFLDCTDPARKAYTIDRKNVSHIELANGTHIEVGSQPVATPQADNPPPPSAQPSDPDYGQEKDAVSSVALVTALLGFLFLPLSLPALVLGIVGLGRHAREPGRFRNRNEAVAAVIIAAIQLLVTLFVFLILLALFL